MSNYPPIGKRARSFREYTWMRAIPMVALHLGALAGLILGASWQIWVLCLGLYLARMFAVTGFYHRYFSHRTFRTSRVMQFVMALWAQSSSQRGVLWWAAHHRNHHKFSDTKHDVHSPRLTGFWHSHVGWLFDHNGDTDLDRVKDLSRYSELRFLNRFWYGPPILLAIVCFVFGGLPGLLIGFMFSTVLVWHGTFTINSLSHVWGTRPYATPDDSRNNAFLALITLGEGWHNNHHHCMTSTRQGFHWWQIDITYYALKGMEKLGLVWNLREPPTANASTSTLRSVSHP